jgi:NADH:ubiquinone oxidoreductase subunit 3 (subunit A)
MQHVSCSIQSYIEIKANFYIIFRKEFVPLAEETVIQFVPILYMLGFGLVAAIPALVISRLLSPRRRLNPIKFLPMECGQMPSGEGRSHFMMQYYAYILMFVVFDVMAIFLYAWGASLFSLPRAATLPMMAFLGIMFAAMGYALYLAGKKGIW